MQRLDVLFDVERGINGKAPTERLANRCELSAPLMAKLHPWLADHPAPLVQLLPLNWTAQTSPIAARKPISPRVTPDEYLGTTLSIGHGTSCPKERGKGRIGHDQRAFALVDSSMLKNLLVTSKKMVQPAP